MTSWTWTPQNIVDLTGGYVASAASGSEAPNPPMSGTTNGVTSVLFYWINPNSTEAMNYTYCTNAGTDCPTVTASFDIQGPAGNTLPNAFVQTNNTATAVTSPQTGSASLTMTNAPGKPTVGIWFNDNATLQQGTFIWVQLLKSVTYSQLISLGFTYSPPPPASNELDGIYPYPSTNSITSDAPSRPLYSGLGEVAEAFDATMYVLWDPAIPPTGQQTCTPAWVDKSTTPYTPHASTCSSIPVPLASVEWKWSACAINSGAGALPSWLLNCGPGYAAQSSASGYPEWNSCYVSQFGGCD